MEESQKTHIKVRGVALACGGLALALALVLDVQEHPFRHRDIQPASRLTVSAGLAAFPEDGTTYEALLKSADDALYRAKNAGRNRIALAGRRLETTGVTA